MDDEKLRTHQEDSAREGWNKHAKGYVEVFEPNTGLWAATAATLAKNYVYSKGGCHSKDQKLKILDIAAGAGGLTFALAHAFPHQHKITAVDISDELLKVLDAKRSPSHAIEVVCQDACAFLRSTAESSVDLIGSNFGMALFPEEARLAAWRSAVRVLKPEGTLVASIWDVNALNIRFMNVIEDYLSTRAPAGEQGTDLAGKQGQAKLNPSMSLEAFKTELEGTGLVDVQVFTVPHSFSFARGEDLINAAQDNPIIQSLMKRHSKDHMDEAWAYAFKYAMMNTSPTNVAARPAVDDLELDSLKKNPTIFSGLAHIALARKGKQ